MPELEALLNDPWKTPLGDLQAGDICLAVPFTLVDTDSQFYRADEQVFAPVEYRFGVVLHASFSQAVVARIAVITEETGEELASLLRDGDVDWGLRLAARPGDNDVDDGWDDAWALLLFTQTYEAEWLVKRRCAAMTDQAATVMRHHLANVLFDG